MTVASRSVKKCHSETVPLSLVGAVLSIPLLVPLPLHPLSASVAAVATAAATMSWRRNRATRVGELIFIDACPLVMVRGSWPGRSGGERIDVAVQALADLSLEHLARSGED